MSRRELGAQGRGHRHVHRPQLRAREGCCGRCHRRPGEKQGLSTGRPLGQMEGGCGPGPRPGHMVGRQPAARRAPWAHSEPWLLCWAHGTPRPLRAEPAASREGVPALLAPGWEGVGRAGGHTTGPGRALGLRAGATASGRSAPLSSLLRSQNANFQNPRCENTPLIGRESPPPSVSLGQEAGGCLAFPLSLRRAGGGQGGQPGPDFSLPT